MENRLYRSETDRMIGGVCGGIGEYFNADPTMIRLVFVVTVILGGGGVLAYLICWIIIPTESSVKKTPNEIVKENQEEIKETVSKTAKGFKTEVKSDTKKENGK